MLRQYFVKLVSFYNFKFIKTFRFGNKLLIYYEFSESKCYEHEMYCYSLWSFGYMVCAEN